MFIQLLGTFAEGLSPLTRGNRAVHGIKLKLRGPIPAHAGQPLPGLKGWVLTRAYPRSRGATCWGYARTSRAVGLSPLTRGNPSQQELAEARLGPIPAHAGQPKSPPA